MTTLTELLEGGDLRMDGTVTYTWPKYHGRPGTMPVTLPAPVVAVLRETAELVELIDNLHDHAGTGFCDQCEMAGPCPTHLLIHPPEGEDQ